MGPSASWRMGLYHRKEHMADSGKMSKERVSRKTLNKQLNKKRSEAKPRSKRYDAVLQKVGDELLTLGEAIAKTKETSTTKFDGSVELHVHLTPKKGKKGVEDELARGMVNLPHGLGKNRKVVILNEDIIATLEKTGKIDFDVAIATPALMPKLGKVAKLLGTKGKMPNPKAGTVTDKPEEVKAAMEAGRVEWRQDAGRNLHQMIGKVSWDDVKLIDNADVFIKLFPPNRVISISLTSTMGPAVKVKSGVK